MYPKHRGPFPWAVILCKFSDQPTPKTPRHKLADMILSSGRGGLYDYWRDVSYGTMTLDGSDVFGWYTMPFTTRELWPLTRERWIKLARELATDHGVDLSAFRRVIAVISAPVDSGASGTDVVATLCSPTGIRRYRFCQRCGLMVSVNNPNESGACAAGGRHDVDHAYEFAVLPDPGGPSTQGGWRECAGCGGLVQGTNPGWCGASGGGHDVAASDAYALLQDMPAAGGQPEWRWCSACGQLVSSGDGPCRRGPHHEVNGSSEYALIIDAPDAPGQSGWRWCKACMGLFYGEGRGPCPAGSPTHNTAKSSTYTLTHNAPLVGGQPDWRYCLTCHGLVFGHGRCEGGRPHRPASSTYSLLMDPAFIGQRRWRLCKVCNALAFAERAGFCQGGLAHDFSRSPDYVVEKVPRTSFGFVSNVYLSAGFMAHETGHGLGLEHAFDTRSTSDGAARDPSDIMSFERSDNWNPRHHGFAGPGLNAPTLHKLGWLPEERVFTSDLEPRLDTPHSQAMQARALRQFPVDLAALTRPEAAGYLMARVVLSDRIFTLAFRERRGWDVALSAPGVEVHELKSLASLAGYAWRFCDTCKGLVDASALACPAGGAHDGSGSLAYAPAPSASKGWRACARCSLLVAPDVDAICPNPLSGSGHVTVGPDLAPEKVTSDGYDPEQSWWTCCKCGSIVLGRRPAPCPLGGTHQFYAGADRAFSVAVEDAGAWRSCSKCRSLWDAPGGCTGNTPHTLLHATDYAVVVNRPGAPGQSDWKLCRNCHCLVFGAGACAAGGVHDVTGSGRYTVAHDDQTPIGQSGWRWCSRCQALTLAGSGTCPSSQGAHATGISNYAILTFGQDLTHFHRRGLRAGDAFEVSHLRFEVLQLDDAAGWARVRCNVL